MLRQAKNVVEPGAIDRRQADEKQGNRGPEIEAERGKQRVDRNPRPGLADDARPLDGRDEAFLFRRDISRGIGQRLEKFLRRQLQAEEIGDKAERPVTSVSV